MEYVEYTNQQLMTVFWPINRTNNNYLNTLISKMNEINSIDITDINSPDKYNQCETIVNEYHKFIGKIRELRYCLDELLNGNSLSKFNKYVVDFDAKIASIHKAIVDKTEIQFSLNNFKQFMYANTPEGRILIQNINALELLNQIKVTEEYAKNLMVMIVDARKAKMNKMYNNIDNLNKLDQECSDDDSLSSDGSLSDNESAEGSLSD